MKYLVDTNVISEMRQGSRADIGVREWAKSTPASSMWISVMVFGELRRGIESLRRRDPISAATLDRWLEHQASVHSGRVLQIDAAVADRWGRLNVPDPVPTTDGLLAATALVHDMVLVTRNIDDFARTEVRLLNPFSSALR